jgi:hypothetical protein
MNTLITETRFDIMKKIYVEKVTKYYAMKTYGGVDIWIHISLISAFVGSEFYCLDHFIPEEGAPGIHWIENWETR